MRIQQLHYIIKIVETGSMNEAAKQLFITQPSLSNAVRDLEREMGIDIVPEFDTPAHSLAFTKVRPDLKVGDNGRQNDH